MGLLTLILCVLMWNHSICIPFITKEIQTLKSGCNLAHKDTAFLWYFLSRAALLLWNLISKKCQYPELTVLTGCYIPVQKRLRTTTGNYLCSGVPEVQICECCSERTLCCTVLCCALLVCVCVGHQYPRSNVFYKTYLLL